MSNLNLLDIAKLNGKDPVVGLIEENLTYAPEVAQFPARTIRGTSYKTAVRTALPTVEFTGANEGVTASKSSFRDELIETYILRSSIKVDVAVANAYEDGPEALKLIEASGVMKSALIEIGKQIWYGVTTDAKGFPGVKAFTPKGGSMTYDAAGTTATTASSVYAVKFGPQDTQLILGNGQSFELGDWVQQQVLDSNNKEYMAWTAGLTCWVGLQLANAYCVGRMCNVTADSGKTCTDAKIAELLALFPVGQMPDALFMSRRSLRQLQHSRTVVINTGPTTKATGAMELVAPAPDSAFGIPIYPTDSILNTDAIES